MSVSLDYALCMGEGVGPDAGISDAELDALAPHFSEAAAAVARRVEGGELGFWKLPGDRDALQQVEAVRRGLPESITDVLILGIGGSSLGARALVDGLCAPQALSGSTPRLHLPDNSDPWLLSQLLDALQPEHTAALVVSKSGGTVETAAQMIVVRDWLTRALEADAVRRRLVAVTDPEKGSLRALARESGWATLPIPSNVGGRFSVLTAVGLMPARLAGIDAEALLSGAAEMATRCETATLRDNPAGLIAALSYLHDRDKGHRIHVMMPYGDRLRAFAAWYVQLWAESLGKRVDRQGKKVELGPTPIPAVGATDQHAQVQLFIEGPRDKLVTFVAVEEPARDLVIPESTGSTSYLSGVSLAQLLDAEREGTTQALASDGRPSMTVTLPRLDASSLGELLFLYQAATAFAGELYGIDAFDQPGVELGKRLAFGLLGREGYEDAGREIRELRDARPTRYRL